MLIFFETVKLFVIVITDYNRLIFEKFFSQIFLNYNPL